MPLPAPRCWALPAELRAALQGMALLCMSRPDGACAIETQSDWGYSLGVAEWKGATGEPARCCELGPLIPLPVPCHAAGDPALWLKGDLPCSALCHSDRKRLRRAHHGQGGAAPDALEGGVQLGSATPTSGAAPPVSMREHRCESSCTFGRGLQALPGQSCEQWCQAAQKLCCKARAVLCIVLA